MYQQSSIKSGNRIKYKCKYKFSQYLNRLHFNSGGKEKDRSFNKWEWDT